MEIAVFIVAPNGIMSDDLVTDPETPFFFNYQEASEAAAEVGPEAKVFQAAVVFWAHEFSPVN